MSEDTTVFRQRLAQLRGNKSRKVISELCGLPSNAIRKYERGEAVPRMSALIQIADYFEVSLDWLTGREK